MERHSNVSAHMNTQYEDSIKTAEGTKKLMSDAVRDGLVVVNIVILCGVLSCFGMVSNMINVMVFLRQGFENNTMNISFFGLAISDLCSLITLLFFTICMNPLFIEADIPFYPTEVQYLTAGWPHACFGRITGWITVYITAERCLCIAMPLKVRQIITPRRTTIILCSIFIFNILSVVPTYSVAYFDWKVDTLSNKTRVGLLYRGDPTNTELFTYLLHSTLLLVAFMAVIIFTTILVVKLKAKSKWRKSVTSDIAQYETLSNRDNKTAKMIIFLSVILVTFFTPAVSLALVTVFDSQFGLYGAHYNLWMGLWTFGFLGEATNSSVNIFIYYKMSSKYRQTFHEIFAFSRNRDNQPIHDPVRAVESVYSRNSRKSSTSRQQN